MRLQNRRVLRCTGFSGVGHWRLDFHGAIVYATEKFLLRDAKITQFSWNTYYSDGGIRSI